MGHLKGELAVEPSSSEKKAPVKNYENWGISSFWQKKGNRLERTDAGGASSSAQHDPAGKHIARRQGKGIHQLGPRRRTLFLQKRTNNKAACRDPGAPRSKRRCAAKSGRRAYSTDRLTAPMWSERGFSGQGLKKPMDGPLRISTLGPPGPERQ